MVCLEIYADKSVLSSFGTAKGYLVMAQILNPLSKIWHGEGVGGTQVVGWLPMVNQEHRLWYTYTDHHCRTVWRRCRRQGPTRLGQFQTNYLARIYEQTTRIYQATLENWVLGGMWRCRDTAHIPSNIDSCSWLWRTVSDARSSYQSNTRTNHYCENYAIVTLFFLNFPYLLQDLLS